MADGRFLLHDGVWWERASPPGPMTEGPPCAPDAGIREGLAPAQWLQRQSPRTSVAETIKPFEVTDEDTAAGAPEEKEHTEGGKRRRKRTDINKRRRSDQSLYTSHHLPIARCGGKYWS